VAPLQRGTGKATRDLTCINKEIIGPLQHGLHLLFRSDAMFKHVLLPSDGSELSQRAVHEGLKLAKEWNASVTIVSVIPRFQVVTLNTAMLEDTREQYLAESRAAAGKHLAALKKEADNAGVPCDSVVTDGDHVHEAILSTAQEEGCDVIVMASHGRRGMQALLIGSETQKVLTHARIPVLVYR
jgi:nucleotide-binding universal stress UspA family protein